MTIKNFSDANCVASMIEVGAGEIPWLERGIDNEKLGDAISELESILSSTQSLLKFLHKAEDRRRQAKK